jgi:hypothetical protein
MYSTIALVALGWGLNAVKTVSFVLCSMVFPDCQYSCHLLRRKIQNTHYTSHICFSLTTSSAQVGQYSSAFIGMSYVLLRSRFWYECQRWVYTPHDGQRMSNSPAQEELIRVSPGSSRSSSINREARIDFPSASNQLTADERASAAYAIWNKEKNTAMFVIIVSWSCKVSISIDPIVQFLKTSW